MIGRLVLLAGIAAIAAGCATTPTDVRQSAPTADYVRAGKAEELRDCASIELEREIGMEATSRKAGPGAVEIALWAGWERKTFLVVELADVAGGVRVRTWRNPHSFHIPGERGTMEQMVARAVGRC